jgi:hypothetical protein
MDWRSLVSTDERLTNILRIAELAHAVQPFHEVLNRAKQVEESVFQKATSREFYIASMDQLVNYMKKTIEDKTKQHLEQLAEKEYKELLNSGDSSSKNRLDQLKILWTKRIDEIMEQSRRQQVFQSQRLHLLLQNLQLQQLLQQQKTRQTQPANLTSLLQPTIPVLQTTLSNVHQPINHLISQPQPTIMFQQPQTISPFYQQSTYSFQDQPMTIQQLFPPSQPSFTLQPLITQQSLTMQTTAPLTTQTKSEQSQLSQSSLPQAYCLVKDANVHKEDFKAALKLPINE